MIFWLFDFDFLFCWLVACLFVCSFVRLFVRSFVCLFVYLFVFVFLLKYGERFRHTWPLISVGYPPFGDVGVHRSVQKRVPLIPHLPSKCWFKL